MNKEELKQKKAYLDFLYYNLGEQNYDFELAGTFKQKDGEIGFSKWKKYSECIFPCDFDGSADDWKEAAFFRQINQRQILPIEVVLDLEDKNQLPEVIKKLKKLGLIYYIFDTGSRGYHAHLYFNEEVEQGKKLAIIKYFGCDEQKDGNRVLIALEWANHWKSNKIKQEVKWTK